VELRPDEQRRRDRRRGRPDGVDPKRVKVRASLFYQSIPPYFLNERFTVGKGDATKRLYYIASNLNLDGTPMENWKMLIAQATAEPGK
jgi:hypothetical protein